MNHLGYSCQKLDRLSRNAIIVRDYWSILELLKFWVLGLILLNLVHFYSVLVDLKIYLISNNLTIG